nr:flagellar filament capping protein FliD [Lachnospiraceae bacterium]
LGTLINKMTSAMSTPITMNGRGYSLSDFGIQTLGYMNAAKNEQYAYHIYGDADDSTVSSKEDKLMSMINSDPDTVIEYMQKLSSNLYDAIGGEMKSSNLRTAYTVYNDKQMKKDYDSYTKSIKEWENKIADMEDRYYKRFSAMESALAKMQSATSSLSSLLGS